MTRWLAASGWCAALAMAQSSTAQQPKPRYSIKDMGTLGGAFSSAYGINNAGWVTGGSATATQTGLAQTGFFWFGIGPLINLGTLGGPSSEAGGPNALGESALISETAKADANGEDFCGFGTHKQCLAAIWRFGSLKALPTLPGGNNAQAYWLNNGGQVAGFAENGVADATCSTATPFQVSRFEAVVWGADGKIKALSPLPGDTVSFAFGINNSGQVIGGSGVCANTSLPPTNPGAPHAVLWDSNGKPTDLGNLGAPGAFGVASSINDRGEVVGGAFSPIDGSIHAFMWTKGTGMQDLGALMPGAVLTTATCCNTVNNSGEIVGLALDATFTPHAWVYKNKMMMDLNTLIPANSGWYLMSSCSLNDLGEIVGYGVINGEMHSFLARPAFSDIGEVRVSPSFQEVTGMKTVPEEWRKAVMRRAPAGGALIRLPGQQK
ncbi:MAG TPA: hypothetical protein VMT15_00065 [Bryobacteraceae bacterium]|nr:hypothetical protein [Bryobacteraceae bacterium]